MKFLEPITERDNETLCAIRVLGFMSLSLVAFGVLIGSGIAEIGIASAAIITSVGGSLKLKGDA